jgi:simple sugar transport system ATP-binding protein
LRAILSFSIVPEWREKMNTLLEVKDISKRFGAVEALVDVGMTVEPGQVMGLVGDNGAGKSTLIKVISGVYQPDGGEMVLDGKPAHFENPRQARDAGIETIYQDLSLADDLNVGANIFLGREPIRRLLGLIPVINNDRINQETDRLLKEIESHIPAPHTPVFNLSGGQRQAVAIARAIYWKAKLVIMDEPTAALAVTEAANVLKLVRSLKDEGIGVIYIDHNLLFVLRAADRITVLYRGHKAFETAADDTSQDELVKYMTGYSQKTKDEIEMLERRRK